MKAGHSSRHQVSAEELLKALVSLPLNSNNLLGGNADFVGMRLRGLPFTVSPTDISNFFQSYNMVPGSIKLGRNDDGRMTG